MAKTLETIASPSLVNLYDLTGKNVVVIDVLRATSTLCTALHNGAKSVIPILNTSEAEPYKSGDFLLAAERGGKKVEGFSYGNSPREYTPSVVKDKDIVLTTTNGTKCIHLSKGAKNIFAGSFVNLSALAKVLIDSKESTVLFCAGWKDKFNLEDFLFAGALAERIKDHFEYDCDATEAAMDLYRAALPNLKGYIHKASHAKRFERLGVSKDIDLCFELDSCPVVPVLKENALVPLSSAK